MRSAFAKEELKNDPALAAKASAVYAKDGSYLLHVVDAATGRIWGKVIVDTGKGSFDISGVMATPDWVIIADATNRILLYSVKTNEVKFREFAKDAVVCVSCNALVVQRNPHELTLFDLTSLQKRADYKTASDLAFRPRFSTDGKRMLLVTDDQEAIFFDLPK